MARASRHVCGRLGQNGPRGSIDFCNQPQDHEGPHRGQYHGMVWEDDVRRRDRSNVMSPGGGTYIKEPGGNIRGDQ